MAAHVGATPLDAQVQGPRNLIGPNGLSGLPTNFLVVNREKVGSAFLIVVIMLWFFS